MMRSDFPMVDGCDKRKRSVFESLTVGCGTHDPPGIVLEGPVTQTGKKPRLNQTATNTTGPAVTVLLAAAPVRSMVH